MAEGDGRAREAKRGATAPRRVRQGHTGNAEMCRFGAACGGTQSSSASGLAGLLAPEGRIFPSAANQGGVSSALHDTAGAYHQNLISVGDR